MTLIYMCLITIKINKYGLAPTNKQDAHSYN